jgi:cell division inhibitor SepF
LASAAEGGIKMATSFFDKVVNFVGLTPEDEGSQETTPTTERRRGALLSLHMNNNNAASSRVVVFHPTTFDEVQKYADALKNRDAVIINFEKIDEALSRRIIDFMNGVTYVLDGDTQKIGNGTMIFAPSNFDVAKDLCYTMPNLYSRKHKFEYLDEK